MRPVALRALLVFSLLALAACGDDDGAPGLLDGPVSEGRAQGEVADRVCYAWRTCDCADGTGVSLSGCETGLGFAWQARQEEAEELGLIFDGACLQRRLNAMLERGCAPFDPTTALCGEGCQVYHGEQPLGAPCEGSGSQSSCAQGLRCDGFDGCVEPPPCVDFGPRAAGASCLDEEGRQAFACEEGLLCDAAGSGQCVAPPTAGQPCVQFQCAAAHWCDASSDAPTCAALLAVGDACTLPQSCVSLQCVEGVCAALPGDGAACSGVCAEGFVCAPGEAQGLVCQAPPGAGEPCLLTTQTQCAEGLACSLTSQTCVSPPGRGQACPDNVCADDLVCLGRSCRLTPSAPGCDSCDDPEGSCIVQVCGPQPAAVCADSGGVLF